MHLTIFSWLVQDASATITRLYNIDMILNLYKEKGWTSFDVVAKVKGILGTKKVGHAGTLDPLAEGVLIVLTDKDTKKQDQFMEMKKEYLATIAFGVQSPTYDLEGALTVSQLPATFYLELMLEDRLTKYMGKVTQQVPIYSAVKVNGTPLYKRARKNATSDIALPSREVTIYELTINKYLSYHIDNRAFPAIELVCVCSKGTYIRSLANDLGNDLGIGGVLVELVRTKVGNYTSLSSQTIAEFEASLKS